MCVDFFLGCETLLRQISFFLKHTFCCVNCSTFSMLFAYQSLKLIQDVIVLCVHVSSLG